MSGNIFLSNFSSFSPPLLLWRCTRSQRRWFYNSNSNNNPQLPSHQQSLQHQPPVYNINKNDFKDVVQNLTGSPAHDRISTLPPYTSLSPPYLPSLCLFASFLSIPLPNMDIVFEGIRRCVTASDTVKFHYFDAAEIASADGGSTNPSITRL